MTQEVASSNDDKAKEIIARVQRLSEWALPRSFLPIIAIGYFFTFYDVTDIGFAMPAIGPQFNLTGSESLYLSLAIGLIGYVIGSFIIGILSDRFGRFRMLVITMALMAIGSFGDAGSLNLTMLVIFRFITGLGLGADLNLIPAYIGEFAPAHDRGHLAQITFFLGILGQAVTPFVALALVPHYYSGWRWLFFIGGLIAVIALILRAQLPESPRWLAIHGKIEHAERNIRKMEEFLTAKGVKLSEPRIEDVSLNAGRFPMSYLFSKKYGRRLVIFGLWWGLWYVGNYAFLGDSATLLTGAGASIANSILYLAIGAIGYPVGAILTYFISDRYERKRIVFIGSIMWLIAMIMVGTRYDAVIISAGSFIASFSLAFLIGLAYMYTSESYPTRARTSGFAMGDGLGHVGGAIGALYLPVLVSAVGFFSGFAIIGVTTIIAGGILLLGPRATQMQLETVSS